MILGFNRSTPYSWQMPTYMPRPMGNWGAPRMPYMGRQTINIYQSSPSHCCGGGFNAGNFFSGFAFGAITTGIATTIGSLISRKRTPVYYQPQMAPSYQQYAQQGPVNYLANLQTIYGNHKIINNGDGTYIVTDGQGHNLKEGTYQQLSSGFTTTA